jgi:hypothetical protein
MYSKLSSIRLCIGLYLLAGVLFSCDSNISSRNGIVPKDGDAAKFKDSERYDFSQPYLINLPAVLDEISGIAYYPKDSSVFAIIDEEALLFKISLNNPNPENIRQWAFGKANDYEDLILKDSIFYVLVSNGNIRTVKFNGEAITTEKFSFIPGSKKKENEFESMYLDSGKIILLCKDCDGDKKRKTSRFSFDMATGKYHQVDSINNSKVAGLIDENKIALRASAAAINPVTNELYVVSAVNKTIYIFDKEGNPKELYELNPKLYKQPEGIAFTPDGDLIISNEIYLEGNPTLLVLKNKKK